MFFDIDAPPSNPLMMLIIPAVLVLVSLLIWYLAYRVEENDKKATWKWIAVLPLAFALYIGFRDIRMVFSSDYALISDTLGRKTRFCLYGAGGLPVIGLIAMVGLSMFQRINNAQRF